LAPEKEDHTMGDENLRCGSHSSGEDASREMKSVALALQLAVLTASLIGCGSIQRGGSTEFPSDRDALPSPSGMFLLRNADADSEQERIRLGDNHALFVENVRTGRLKKIYAYSRHVAVKWSPHSHHLAITDFDGSDHATCQLFSVATEKCINVEAAIRSEFGRYHRELAASHLYFTAALWTSDNSLEVTATGYGFPVERAIKRTYVYNLSTGAVASETEKAKR
jgi:hypothetical protein